MSSVVFYKFKSQKEPSRIAFDGTGISVWELKKEIILESKLGKGSDFDFSIYNENDEEYGDDHAVIPRSTSVLARRLPPSKPGRGNGQIYMAAIEGASGGGTSGKGNYQSGGGGGGGSGNRDWKAGSMSKRFDGKEDYRSGNNRGQEDSSSQEPNQVILPAAAGGDEASALAAMFAATSQQWQQTQEQMATATPIYRAPMPRVARPPPVPRDYSANTTSTLTSTTASGSAAPSTATVPNTSTTGGGDGSTSAAAAAYHANQSQHVSASHKPPPAAYICYRCGQKGHWIQDCPTNSDKAFDDKPRIKRTTGIPKSFLTVVEGPISGSGATGAQVMVTPDGGFVVARPDNDSWLAHRSLTANLSATDIQNLAPTDPDLTCPICSKLLRDSVLTPCCKTAFCEDCLHNALGDNDMLCPECESKVKNLGKLEVDKGRRERCRVYIEAMVEASKEVAKAEEIKVEAEAVKEEEVVAASVELTPAIEEVKKEVEEAAGNVEVATNVPQVIVNGGDALDSLIATVTSGGNTPVLHIGSPNSSNGSNQLPSTAPTGSSTQMNNSYMQAQFLQQQQLQQQQQMQQMQQQRAMVMQQQQQQQQQQQGGMGISPQMLQQNMYQINMNLSNPQLHPQMRMQLQMQLQQCQIMAVQMGLISAAGSSSRLGNTIAQAYGGNFANGIRNGISQQQQQQQHQMGVGMRPQPQQQQQAGVPTGPRGGVSASDNLKRSRPEDFATDPNERRRAPSPADVPQGAP